MTADTAGPAVRTTDLTKTYGDGETAVTALDHASLTIPRGDFVAVMGASGSGKSTLLHLMAGLTDPTSGTVEVNGKDIQALDDDRLAEFRRRHIGLVFQSYNLIPSLSVEDNIRLPLLLDGRGHTAEGVDELLTTLGLAGRRKHRPHELSGGEQQRVAIGRALVTQPAVVLADEPTGNVDSATTAHICKLLKTLNEEHRRTIAVVTHEPEVAVWAKRVVILRDGAIVGELAVADFEDARALDDAYHACLTAPVAGAPS